ncbi:MAG: hypothetical protein KC733_10565 [Candidatus Omnitrophica bacterium]|nr:hypothetical protein [Candidatus Omnitrophota bacterium]
MIFLFNGCAYKSINYQAIRQLSAKINAVDGIDANEAILLAQNHIINKGMGDRLYSLKPINVKYAEKWFKDGIEVEFAIAPRDRTGITVERWWEILFRDREGSQLWGIYPVIPFYVHVDADTGVIKGWGLKRE